MASSPGSLMKRVRARENFSRIPSDEFGMSRCIVVPPPGVALTFPLPPRSTHQTGQKRVLRLCF